ncbi:MAG TPA: bifunctional glutamate N-acetyltransferase/amino-acid acetyltransferase ArgJ [Bacillota bacterium]|nr:bifunctional glutamate N-acetyltransferase/amino-acid acetyltransferase ArgJ [Bacillota bacterium]
MKKISKGVCAPKGFKANGIHAGIRKNKTKKDLSLIYSEKRANAAAVYTQNLVKGAPIKVTKEHLSDNMAQVIICNSGNANTCNANGIEIANETSSLLAEELMVDAEDIVLASTGVIGQPLSIEPFKEGIPSLVSGLGDHSTRAAEAIMTTDTRSKEVAISFDINGVECRIGGMAKGSGMIEPNMATLLVFLTTDCAISSQMLQKALSSDTKETFNMVSIDGDTSTNDMAVILANAMAENEEIRQEGAAFDTFKAALNEVTIELCSMIVADGEGATRMIECQVTGALTNADAKLAAKAVINSVLVKTMVFGSDANWGRVLCALGYSGAKLDVGKIDVKYRSLAGEIPVCKDGYGLEFSDDLAKSVLSEDEIRILIDLKQGQGQATAWGCDLTYDYVKINGDYRT